MIIADTDVLIDSLHGKEPVKERIELELETGRLATTAITAFELLGGARTPKHRAKVEILLAAMKIVPLDDSACREAADIRLELESKGMGLSMADYLIAGICLSRSAILLTRNRKHFERVSGLVLGTLTST